MNDKIIRPKLRLKTSPAILKLASEIEAIVNEMHKILNLYKQYRDKPNTKGFSKALELRGIKYPTLKKEYEGLLVKLNKEMFKAATGKDLEDAEKDAIADGEENSCLLLLRWKIEYLENEQLRAKIYIAHQKRRPSDLIFLEEVAHIIEQPKKTHKNADIRKLNAVIKLYDSSKTTEKNLELFSEKGLEVSDKYIRRIGLRKK